MLMFFVFCYALEWFNIFSKEVFSEQCLKHKYVAQKAENRTLTLVEKSDNCKFVNMSV